MCTPPTHVFTVRLATHKSAYTHTRTSCQTYFSFDVCVRTVCLHFFIPEDTTSEIADRYRKGKARRIALVASLIIRLEIVCTMTTEPYRCSYTWTVTEGVSEKEVTVQMCESPSPEFAPIDELLDLDRCLILNGSDGQDSCEMRLSVIPLYLPRAISLVVECPVIECYHGRLNEYYKTYHGELVYTLGGVKVFRFDIRITTDLDELQLKFITPKNEPLCLYGTRLYLARNPNPLHSAMLRGRRINPASVQQRLEDTDLSDKAEKCKRLVLGAMQSSEQNVTNNNDQTQAPAEQTTVLPDTIKDSEGNLTNLFGQLLLPGQSSHSAVLEMFMKQYIDQKFSELEQMFEMKLSSLESRQNKKLDQILTLLQGQNVDRPASQPCDAVE